MTQTEIINEIEWAMRQKGLTRADLAKRTKLSPGRIAQILSGGEKLTAATLLTLGNALDMRWVLS